MKKIIYKIIDKLFLANCSHYNSLSVRQKVRSKQQARKIFKQNDIPYAQGMSFINPYKAFVFAKKYGFPLVVKPNIGGYSRGSHFPIKNYFQLFKAVFLVKIWWPKSIIEKYLEGKNYRIIVVENEIMSLIERFPAQVIGDGIHSVQSLIALENNARQTMKLHPIIHPLKINRMAKKLLKQQKYRS